MPRALLSVSRKDGILHFARELHERGWTLLSTGGTARVLRDAALPVHEVSEITGHPEIMDGRVKTLHPAVHGALLARRDHAGDLEQLSALGYEPIDLVCVNLYPFRETVEREGVTMEEAVESIDIGGPSMLRSAAKNHRDVWAVVDPEDYQRVTAALDAGEEESRALRRSLAAKVFEHTALYDAMIAGYLSHREEAAAGPEDLPQLLTLELERLHPLRYGENPDQRAGFYMEPGAEGLSLMRQMHGRELSFNNLLDVDAATIAVSAWSGSGQHACAIIKHTTPCGVAIGSSAADAYHKALATDPTSAFGSVVAFNGEVTEEAALLLRPNFVEAVVAPSFAEAALDLLREKKNLRLILLPLGTPDELDYKRVQGGFLVQERLRLDFSEAEWRVVTRREPTAEEWEDLRFAWRAVASVKSNAILLARGGATVGIGAGQMSRVDSSRIAVLKAQDNQFELHGAVLASDAFFPFRDGVDAAAQAGVRAIVQPGGSVRDPEVIAAADEQDVAMVLTGRRLFRH